MRLHSALRHVARAARVNLLPGLLLQAVMLGFFALYAWNEPTRELLAHVADLKARTGMAFAFFSYVIAAAFLPELLRVLFFQRGRPTRTNVWNFLTAIPLWGSIGIIVDGFYGLQAQWFGSGREPHVLALKVLVDQFLYSPFVSVPLVVGYLAWRDRGYRFAALAEIATVEFFLERMLPVIVSGWFIWIPGVTLVYTMPPLLQLPVAVTIQVFAVLVIMTLCERRPE